MLFQTGRQRQAGTFRLQSVNRQAVTHLPVPDKYLQPRIFGDLIQEKLSFLAAAHHTFPIVNLRRLQKSHHYLGNISLPGIPQLFTVVVVPPLPCIHSYIPCLINEGDNLREIFQCLMQIPLLFFIPITT